MDDIYYLFYHVWYHRNAKGEIDGILDIEQAKKVIVMLLERKELETLQDVKKYRYLFRWKGVKTDETTSTQ